jgi:hydroxymethylpyrimidine kinase/phosphomethylpyrimidine kinase/thiamine-phosphate diphosphorylase
MNLLQRPALAWTIAGSDSGGGAGIQADLKTFHDFDVHGCSVITALTAQNSIAVGHIEVTPKQSLAAQINALDSDLPADAIKIGMLASAENTASVAKYLTDYQGKVVFDPVLKASSGTLLGEESALDIVRNTLLSLTDIITPNRDEAAALIGKTIEGHNDIPCAAQTLLDMGAKSVLITGGHFDPIAGKRLDYWSDGNDSFWIAGPSIDSIHNHGSGCTLSSAIAACLAKGYAILDALVLAKAYITRGIRNSVQLGGGPGPVSHGHSKLDFSDFPTLYRHPSTNVPPTVLPELSTIDFAACNALGLYPVVDSVEWIARLLPLGIKTVQLRIKDTDEENVRQQIQQAVAITQQYDAQFFVNDYWQLAIELGAYGVHLGQEDLDTADLEAIAKAGLRLGVSTHSYYEIARAHAIKPSYIAIGPIYDTQTKVMNFKAQGVEQLQQWVELLSPHYPLTAIGGISVERVPKILATGINSCAMVTAITLADNVDKTVQQLLKLHEPS